MNEMPCASQTKQFYFSFFFHKMIKKCILKNAEADSSAAYCSEI